MEKIKILARDIGQTISRYYGVLAVALLATAGFIAESANRESRYSEVILQKSEIYVKLGLLGLMGIALLFALHIAQQRYRIKWPLPILGFLVLAGYYVLLPPGNFYHTQPITAVVLSVSGISFHLLVAIVPFLATDDRDGFWDYNKAIFINAVQTVVFTLVLWGGLALAAVAVERLFNIDVPSVFWERLAITVLIMGSSLIFLLFSKGGLAELKTPLPYPSVLKFFVQYVLVPLLIIYLIILYSYGIKILVEWDLPQGWVSYLVLAYSSLGILSLLLLNPLSGVDDKIWVSWFSRIFYLTLVPLLVLLFVAIGVRIADYGVTENRYYVLVLAMWLLAVTGYHLLGFKNGIKVIPVSLFAIGMGSLLLPFANVFHISFASQGHRLHQLLSQHEVLDERGKIDFAKPVPHTILREIGSKFDYLKARKQQEVIRALVPGEQITTVDSLLNDRWTGESGFTTMFTNVVEDDDTYHTKYTRLVSGKLTRVYSITGYDYMVPVVHLGDSVDTQEFTLGDGGIVLQVGDTIAKDTPGVDSSDKHPTLISVRSAQHGLLFSYDYSRSTDSIYARYTDKLFKTYTINVDDISTTFHLGDYQLKIHYNEIEFRVKDEEQGDGGTDDNPHIYGRAAIFIKK